jgi:branched-chain amino acid aminotransferase
LSEPDGGAASPPWTAGAAWIDGRYCPVGDARISVLDLGVTRSDCTYDVVHVWQGRFYRLDAHLDRFAASMARLRLDPGQDRAGIEDILHGCVRRAGLRDAYVSMTCTRGRMPPGSRDLRTARNSFYCYALPFIWISRPEQQETGARMRISELTRIPPQSVDPTVKNYHWLDFTSGLLDAYERGAETVVLVDPAGNVVEGPGFNLFAVRGGVISTPAEGVLDGITRRTVIELARDTGTTVREEHLPAQAVREADEIFLTSTAGGVMPVTSVDGVPLGEGTPGPVARSLRDAYWRLHEDPRYATPVAY